MSNTPCAAWAERPRPSTSTNRRPTMAFKRSLILPLAVFLAGLSVLIVTMILLLQPQQQQNAGRVPIGGPFRLTSHEGKPFTDNELKGKPFAVFFGFTHCP